MMTKTPPTLDRAARDHCVACDYPRRGLTADAPCPECGTTPPSADERTERRAWRASSTAARTAVRDGLLIVMLGLIGAIGAAAGLMYDLAQPRATGVSRAAGTLIELAGVLGVVSVLVMQYGWWRAANVEFGRRAGALAHVRLLRLVAVMTALGALIFMGVMVMRGPPMHALVTLVVMASIFIGCAVSFPYLMVLARGSRRPTLPAELSTLGWWMMIMAVPQMTITAGPGVVICLPFWLVAVAMTRYVLVVSPHRLDRTIAA